MEEESYYSFLKQPEHASKPDGAATEKPVFLPRVLHAVAITNPDTHKLQLCVVPDSRGVAINYKVYDGSQLDEFLVPFRSCSDILKILLCPLTVWAIMSTESNKIVGVHTDTSPGHVKYVMHHFGAMTDMEVNIEQFEKSVCELFVTKQFRAKTAAITADVFAEQWRKLRSYEQRWNKAADVMRDWLKMCQDLPDHVMAAFVLLKPSDAVRIIRDMGGIARWEKAIKSTDSFPYTFREEARRLFLMYDPRTFYKPASMKEREISGITYEERLIRAAQNKRKNTLTWITMLSKAASSVDYSLINSTAISVLDIEASSLHTEAHIVKLPKDIHAAGYVRNVWKTTGKEDTFRIFLSSSTSTKKMAIAKQPTRDGRITVYREYDAALARMVFDHCAGGLLMLCETSPVYGTMPPLRGNLDVLLVFSYKSPMQLVVLDHLDCAKIVVDCNTLIDPVQTADRIIESLYHNDTFDRLLVYPAHMLRQQEIGLVFCTVLQWVHLSRTGRSGLPTFVEDKNITDAQKELKKASAAVKKKASGKSKKIKSPDMIEDSDDEGNDSDSGDEAMSGAAFAVTERKKTKFTTAKPLEKEAGCPVILVGNPHIRPKAGMGSVTFDIYNTVRKTLPEAYMPVNTCETVAEYKRVLSTLQKAGSAIKNHRELISSGKLPTVNVHLEPRDFTEGDHLFDIEDGPSQEECSVSIYDTRDVIFTALHRYVHVRMLVASRAYPAVKLSLSHTVCEVDDVKLSIASMRSVHVMHVKKKMASAAQAIIQPLGEKNNSDNNSDSDSSSDSDSDSSSSSSASNEEEEEEEKEPNVDSNNVKRMRITDDD